jgi:hypothetical protein
VNKPLRFLHIPIYTEAIQYDGLNVEAISEFVGDKDKIGFPMHTDSWNRLFIFIDGSVTFDRHPLCVVPNFWVLKDPEGRFSILEPGAFETAWRKV